MTGQWKEVARLSFKGERFRDHALDLSALSELRHFQKLVAETAKALWKRANSDKQRLPAHFDDRTRLCLRRIEEGSAVAPLEVFIEEPGEREFFEPEPLEVNEAIDLAYRVFEAASRDALLPEGFPKSLVADFAHFGSNLAEGESLEFAPVGKKPTRISAEERERLQRFVEATHESEVDVQGAVLEADVRQRKFQLWFDDQTSAQVLFTEDQESQVTTALRDHKTLRLRVRGKAEFSPQGTLRRVVTVESLALLKPGEIEYDDNAPAIEDVIRDIFKDVPDKEWDKLPPDLTDRIDYYLYGVAEE